VTANTLLRKSFAAVETKVLDANRGLVETVFSVTGNVDRQNDVIDSGAFAKALAAKASVPVVYAHKWDDINAVLGKTVQWRELLPGDPGLPDKLRVKGLGGVKAVVQFDQETPSGRVAFTHVKNGNLTDWSFAFDVDDDGEKYDDGGTVRHLKSIREIYEVTLALIGANPDTQTLDFKALVLEEAAESIESLISETTANLLELSKVTEVKPDLDPFIRARVDALLSDLLAAAPSVPDDDRAHGDEQPDFDHFIRSSYQGVVTRGY